MVAPYTDTDGHAKLGSKFGTGSTTDNMDLISNSSTHEPTECHMDSLAKEIKRGHVRSDYHSRYKVGHFVVVSPEGHPGETSLYAYMI